MMNREKQRIQNQITELESDIDFIKSNILRMKSSKKEKKELIRKFKSMVE